MPLLAKLSENSSFLVFFAKTGGLTTLYNVIKLYLKLHDLSKNELPKKSEFILIKLLNILRNLAAVKEIKEIILEMNVLNMLKISIINKNLKIVADGISIFIFHF